MASENRRNYYRILHVQPDAPDAVIRASYRTIMQKLRQHPDLGGDTATAALINEAYAVLSHADRRRAYDRSLASRQVSDDPRPHRRDAEPPPRRDTGPSRTDLGSCPFCRLAVNDRITNCPRCMSPLQRVAPSPAGTDRRRRIERLATDETVTVLEHWQGTTVQATMSDLSPQGCQLRMSKPLPAGGHIRIENRRLTAVGLIHGCRHVAAGPEAAYFLAIEFETLRFNHPTGGFISTQA